MEARGVAAMVLLRPPLSTPVPPDACACGTAEDMGSDAYVHLCVDVVQPLTRESMRYAADRKSGSCGSWRAAGTAAAGVLEAGAAQQERAASGSRRRVAGLRANVARRGSAATVSSAPQAGACSLPLARLLAQCADAASPQARAPAQAPAHPCGRDAPRRRGAPAP